jgi:hypothetical protein
LTKSHVHVYGDSTLSVQQAAVLTCERILTEITPSDFSIQVTGNNPQPSTFNGSAIGTNVTIGPGGYTVTETPNAQVIALLANANVNLTTTFTGGCTPAGTGTIEGVPETCNITNTFTINGDPETTLNVRKIVSCEDLIRGFCSGFPPDITPASFTSKVADSLSSDTFPGNATGTQIQITPSTYTVTETSPTRIPGFTLETEFHGDCFQMGQGTIAIGETKSCLILNAYTAASVGITGASSSITAQVIENSPKLTTLENQPDDLSTMEKINKLKTTMVESTSKKDLEVNQTNFLDFYFINNYTNI